ncbi:MAG: bdr protein [Candidatus Magnetoglobus multicellularis str. Araruama]|uniref:Bdr protein n=1 Tax=Candidatus Magnetoglobus multicellularis str. Araruama TaxID=890399 RepID=A0A1V1PEE7_9BACT|nr:MAG: bdr protein [Candidatus Magnetoglobus multicellularis str. Araruama]
MKAAQVTRTVNYPILTNIHPLVTEITEIFPNDQSPPLITMFKYLDERINNHQKGLDSFEKSLKTIEFIKKNQENMKVEIKKDLLVELATKADINEIRGEMNTKLSELRGDMNTKLEGLRGEITAVATELRGEMDTFRNEIYAQLSELRGDMNTKTEGLRGEITAVATELRGEITAVAKQLSGEINSLNNKLSGEINTKNNKLRGDLEKQIADLRGEMRTGFEMIRADISNLKVWFKMFTFSALIIVFMFSPNFITLLKYLKWF